MTVARVVRHLLAARDPRDAVRRARAHREHLGPELSQALADEFDRLVRTRPQAAGRAAIAAAAVARVAPTPHCSAIAQSLAGIADHLAGRHGPAARRLERATDLFVAAGRPAEAGDAQRVLIDALKEAGEGEAALRAGRRAASLYAKAGRIGPKRRGSLAMNLGNLHHHRDELDEALAAYGEARRHYRRAGRPLLLASVDYNRANILASLDRVDEARALYLQARAAFEADRLGSLVVQCDYALAGLDLLEGRLDEAVGRLVDVGGRFSALKDRRRRAHADLDLAEAYLRLNRSIEARVAARRALAYFRRTGQRAESATCLGRLGWVELQRGRPAAARRLFERARELHAEGGNRVAVAGHRAGLAQAALHLGEAESALSDSREAARVLRGAGLRSRESRARSLTAAAAVEAGRLDLALKEGRKALDLARSRKDLRAELAAQLALARAERQRGRSGAEYRRLLSAARCVDRMRCGIETEESHLSFALDKSEVYERLVDNRLAVGTPSALRQALSHAEQGKARALAERLARGPEAIRWIEGSAARAALRRLRRLERRLAVAEARRTGDPRPGVRSAAVRAVPAVLAERDALLRRLERRDPERALALSGRTPDPLRALALLPEGERVVEYFETNGEVHAFVAGPSGVEARPRLARVDDLRDPVDLLRFQLGKGVLPGGRARTWARAALSRHLARLHDLLLEPLWPLVKGRPLRFVPHGILHGLPFHAFERDGVPLVERSVVSYAPSLAVLGLLARAPRQRSSRPLVLGVPDSAAPQIEEEVRAVKRHLRRARVLRGATGRGLRLAESAPSVLHVACHGFFSEGEPGSGGLRLGDGWVGVADIQAMRSTGELVVLSGCETGRGNVQGGDEWLGLVRGFLQAGARAVVASLWEVHDRAASALMSDFYRRLAAGSSVASALAAAQRQARLADPDPLLWAPFMVIGDPDLRLSLREAA